MDIQFGEGAFVQRGVTFPARTILTTQPNDVNNAAWSKAGATTGTDRTDPWGGTTAESMLETTANSNHEVFQNGIVTLVNGTLYLQEAIVKPIGGRLLKLRTFANGFASAVYMWFDLANKLPGQISFYGTDFRHYGGSIEQFSGGYLRCRLFFKALSNNSVDGRYFASQDTDGSDAAFVGDVAKGLDFHYAAVSRVP